MKLESFDDARRRSVANSATSLAATSALAVLHKVHWQIYPEYRLVDEQLVKVGFELVLFGTHDHPSQHPAPGCDACVKVYKALSRVAGFALPREERPTLFEIEPFEAALLYPVSGTPSIEVAMRIRLLHRADSLLPIDECQRRCLAEIEDRLRQLGVRKAR